MKLLSVKEVTDKKQAELQKEIVRGKETKEYLEKLTRDLAETEARFNMVLANQRIRYAQEEEEHLKKMDGLRAEIKILEDKKKEIEVPMEKREKKSYDLLNAAEKTFDEALEKTRKADERKAEVEETASLLQIRLDDVSDRETDVLEREQKVQIREEAVNAEREMISKLSSELSIKLQNIK